jgi:hypothetical protein
VPVDLLAAAATVKAAAPKPPTTELGTGTTSGLRPVKFPAGGLLGSWSTIVDEAEQVPDLKWAPYGRGAVGVYDKMRTDPQIHGLVAWGLMMPIRRFKWHVEPNGASDRTASAFAEDLNLPIKDQPRETLGRTKGRFSHDDHLRHALLAPGSFGHMFFEEVGEIDSAGWFRLRKLAPRMPQSLDRIEVDEHGDLAGIVQRGGPDNYGVVEIPVSRLAPYVWEREGSQWIGRSLLRAMYGPWLVKQRLIRVDAIKHERNGMGVPVTRQTVPDVNPGAMAAALQVAESIRAGEVAGASLPYGFDLALQGVSGSLPDTMASIRYCDEVMARSLMMMFASLGQGRGGSGSRALGETFVDYFKLTQDAIAGWYVDNTSMVGEDYADWNDGPGSQAPRIGYDRDEHEELAVADLLIAIEAGVVTLSEEDEVAFRERYDLPPMGATPRARPSLLPPAVPALT